MACVNDINEKLFTAVNDIADTFSTKVSMQFFFSPQISNLQILGLIPQIYEVSQSAKRKSANL
jgi:hypothetical protein